MYQGLLTPPGARRRSRIVVRKSRLQRAVKAIGWTAREATELRAEWERALALAAECEEGGDPGITKARQQRAALVKLAMAREVSELCDQLAELVDGVIGDWRPGPGEVGTGLTDAQLEKIQNCSASGRSMPFLLVSK